MGRTALLTAAILLFNVALGQVEDTSGPIGVFDPAKCLFEVLEWVTRAVDCGFVTVPAFHAQPERGTFRLPVVIFRSAAKEVKPDPLIHLHGGPGANLIPGTLLNLYPAFDLMAPERDIIMFDIMFDQRGASAAEPQFVCSAFNAAVMSYRGPVDEAKQ